MHRQTKRVSESGFSLIELMIVMIVMLIVMGAIFTLMKSSLDTSNATYELTDSQENLRIAHEYLNRDIIAAGDGLNGINNIQVAQGFVNAYLAQTIVTDPTKPGYVNLPILASDYNVPGTVVVAGANPATNVLGGTDRITILAVDSTFTPSISIAAGGITSYGATVKVAASDGNRLQVGEIYCFTSQSGAAFGAITAISTAGATSTLSFSSASSYGLNQPVSTGPINLAGAGNASGISTQAVSIMRVKIIHYYINSSKQLCKRVFGVAGAGFTDNLVAEHITDLSFRYILGLTNADGSVQQPVNQLTTSPQQVAVRQVETSITAETTHPTNFQNSTHAQQTMTTTASVRNLQFRQAQQPQSGG